MLGGFSKVLAKGKKNPWPTLSLTISAYTVKDFREVETKAKQIKGFCLPPLAHQTYDLEKIIPAHCKQAKLKWIYQHTDYPDEYRIKNWYNKDREAPPAESSDQEEKDN